MKFKTNSIRTQINENNKLEIVLKTDLCVKKDILNLKEILEKGKELIVDIKQYRKKRSLDANAYMWQLISKIAKVIHSSKDEVYLEMLERYGVFTHVIVKKNIVNKIKQEWKTVKELGEVKVNGVIGIQLQCFFGSSTYNSNEMANLINGVVSEAKDLDIETMNIKELDSIKANWGV